MPPPLVGSSYWINVGLWILEVHTIIKQLHDGVFPMKEVVLKKTMTIYIHLSKSTQFTTRVFPIHMKILKLKENYAHVIPSPTRRRQ